MLPFFPAVLAAMYLGALTASNVLVPPRELPVVLPPAPEKIRTRPEISSAFLREPEDLKDEVMELCLKSESRQWALDFFALLCGSSETARIILEESERRGVSPSLAFALCWEESRYDSQAVNRRNRNGSVDRGLFQLNSASFPALGEADFFNPRTNAYYGIAHLRLCLDAGASEIAALAMYNAGAARVRADGTPRQTLDYADRVLSSRRKIDALFRGEWAAAQAAEQAAAPVEPEEPVELPPPAFPPLILSPLSR
jgi:soluble lytic murein transglycosylase-like protein